MLKDTTSTKAEQLIIWQTALWRRRAKIRWCVSGDENSKFFHAAANCQARRTKIKVLVHNGVEHYQNDQKLCIATKYFSAILGQSAILMPTIQLNSLYTPADLSRLAASFSWAEIIQAINMAPNNRSPGPDGFTNEFYKVFKHLLKDDLLSFFDDFHINNVNLDALTLPTSPCCLKKTPPWKLRIIGLSLWSIAFSSLPPRLWQIDYNSRFRPWFILCSLVS